MRIKSMFIGLFALVCSFGVVHGKTAGHPAGTLNKPIWDAAKTVSNPDGTLNKPIWDAAKTVSNPDGTL